MATAKITPKLVLLMIPGTLAWALIFAGIFSDDETLIGTGAAIIAVTVVVGLTLKLRRSSSERAEVVRIWREGTPARARIIDISTGGGGFNDNPRVDFELEVRMGEQPAYPVEVSAIISKLAIPRIQPDCEIEIRVDPEDRSKVALDAKLVYPRYE